MAAKPPAAAKRSLQARLTTKAGPLPVWAWAALILGAYLAYTKLGGGSSSSGAATAPASSTDQNTTPVSNDSGNPVGGGGGGNAAGNVNDQLLSQLSGFQTSIDGLTAAVQSSVAPAGGSSGIIDWSGTPTYEPPVQSPPAPTKKPAASPFGGVASSKKLKNGATLITYRNGRQVEQVPGKPAYVVKR